VSVKPARLELDDIRRIRVAADEHAASMVQLAQHLIQTQSLPGEEHEISDLVLGYMRDSGYDDAWRDEAGNIIGMLRGAENGSRVQFNTHLDHVSAGDPNLWDRPPFAGLIEDGILYGRGASDIKGAMAAQLALVPALRAAGLKPKGDVYVVAVVLEEVGGYGSRHLAQTMPTDIAVIGEATNNELRRGHRGRVFVEVSFTGFSTHASAPERGRNPHYAAARFLLKIEHLGMAPDPTFGSSTMAPTWYETDQTSGNVTPGTVTVFLDWRNVPGESESDVLGRIEPIAHEAAREVEDITASVSVVGRKVETYTGLSDTMPSTLPFETAEDDPALVRARAALESAFNRDIPVGTWTFATDGGHLHQHGVTTLGFGPSEERFAHTIHDQVSLKQLHEALVGNAVLAIALSALSGGRQ
jgi:succinyl-diaminopimelate desuccinylase